MSRQRFTYSNLSVMHRHVGDIPFQKQHVFFVNALDGTILWMNGCSILITCITHTMYTMCICSEISLYLDYTDSGRMSNQLDVVSPLQYELLKNPEIKFRIAQAIL